MADLVLRNAQIVLCMDGAQSRHEDVDILVDKGEIIDIGQGIEAQCESVDIRGYLVTPGLVNTHHHLFQNLTRAVPAAQNASLFDWLTTLYPIWARLTPEHLRASTEIGLAELALSGCSMTSDHLYLFPGACRLDDTIEAAAPLGLRFHPTRGAMSIGQSAGGLPPDSLVEREPDILADMERIVGAHHNARAGAMLRVGLAPCSPFSVSRELMRDSAILARELGVRLHTHLAENDEDILFSLEKFGCSPGEYAEDLGWTGEDVWHAHCVKLTPPEITLFARTGTGVAHCPCSNCRLGSGIAPVRAMRDAGVPVGLGVDGSASNDSANLALEARQAMLLQRVMNAPGALSPYEALWLATRGGAQVLGREDCGQIAVGKRADLAVWDLGGVESAGSWDPAAFLLAGPAKVRDLFVEGRRVVAEGRLTTLDLPIALERHGKLAKQLMDV
ncbi:MAG: 8-oxoguanine deaminase [Pseudomonadota bacterium]